MRTLAIALLACSGCIAAAPALDGVRIVNSGSTNTSAWSLTVRTDGSGTYTIRARGLRVSRSAPAPVQTKIDPALVRKLITDAKAARAAKVAGAPCMKSASFGSTTVVNYHGWNSPDLQCPPSSGLLITLAGDVGQVQQAAGINTLRRVGLPPHEMRRVPEPSHTPAAVPSQGTIREHA